MSHLVHVEVIEFAYLRFLAMDHFKSAK